MRGTPVASAPVLTPGVATVTLTTSGTWLPSSVPGANPLLPLTIMVYGQGGNGGQGGDPINRGGGGGGGGYASADVSGWTTEEPWYITVNGDFHTGLAPESEYADIRGYKGEDGDFLSAGLGGIGEVYAAPEVVANVVENSGGDGGSGISGAGTGGGGGGGGGPDGPGVTGKDNSQGGLGGGSGGGLAGDGGNGANTGAGSAGQTYGGGGGGGGITSQAGGAGASGVIVILVPTLT